VFCCCDGFPDDAEVVGVVVGHDFCAAAVCTMLGLCKSFQQPLISDSPGWYL
jgi:hypothetical protein